MLALVPSIAMVALWTVSSERLYADWREQKAQSALSHRAGLPSTLVYDNLQEERRLSAEVLADPAASRKALTDQRDRTDQAVRSFQALSGIEAGDAPEELRFAVADARDQMERLSGFRDGVDRRVASQQVTFAYYTGLIETDLRLFTALSNVDNGQVSYLSRTLVDAFWAKEMLSREDALLARAEGRRLDVEEHQQLVGWIGAQQFALESKVAPYLDEAEALVYSDLTEGTAWQGKDAIERTLVHLSPAGGGTVAIPPSTLTQWRQSVDQVTPTLQRLLQSRTLAVAEVGDNTVHALQMRLITTGAVGLAGVLLVVLVSVRLTGSLRRRIFSLRDDARQAQTTLPELVDRLSAGESVDLAAETRETPRGSDELGQLEDALAQARRSAVETAVRQAAQHRGFERLLQRIARRTQLLIGLQLKKLDEMERRHEDPEVLEGLFDLDHLTARLRRYEENLVILGGGQPQRRWRKPVRLLDVLRAAQGEVRDYRRVQIEVEGRPWVAERAVGTVVHVLAELMENAASFSKPPTPVEVRAASVGRGLVVEIEDRGLGMEPEQYAAANRLMADPPRMDVMTRADDARLGLYVVARLAAGLGLQVEFRASAFGGTRVIVLIPAELVAEAPEGAPAPHEPHGRGGGRLAVVDPVDGDAAGAAEPEAVPVGGGPAPVAVAELGPTGLPVRSRGRAMSAVAGSPETAKPAEPTGTAGAADPARSDRPLPRRVRQASLVDELREPAARPQSATGDTPSPRTAPTRFGPAIRAFQRQSRIARSGSGTDDHHATGATPPEVKRPTTEDR
ncbi:sensor histidine kinase [Peterkaempfera bronchialis]|uniref:sensor histidine kinase n=1 Tax=Peterkaempfera bronchialis TaxID=2126346 RepID=UPI001E546E67|nr:nitrate- and nitrite sensing domain-containing protein [Peterkaempfera bronchialis]